MSLVATGEPAVTPGVPVIPARRPVPELLTIWASCSSVQRTPSGAKCAGTSRIGLMRTALPWSLPSYCLRSSSEPASTTTTSTVPVNPVDQALAIPMTGNAVGAVTWREKRSCVQPRPNGPQGSRAALVRPQSAIVLRVHSFARRSPGDPVSRGPMTSVRYSSVSGSCDRVSPSLRILETTSGLIAS